MPAPATIIAEIVDWQLDGQRVKGYIKNSKTAHFLEEEYIDFTYLYKSDNGEYLLIRQHRDNGYFRCWHADKKVAEDDCRGKGSN